MAATLRHGHRILLTSPFLLSPRKRFPLFKCTIKGLRSIALWTWFIFVAHSLLPCLGLWHNAQIISAIGKSETRLDLLELGRGDKLVWLVWDCLGFSEMIGFCKMLLYNHNNKKLPDILQKKRNNYPNIKRNLIDLGNLSMWHAKSLSCISRICGYHITLYTLLSAPKKSMHSLDLDKTTGIL